MSGVASFDVPAEDRLLFACLRQDFDRVEASRVASVFGGVQPDWNALGRIAIEHGVGGLLYVNLRRCAEAGLQVPVDLLKRLRLALFQSVAEQQRRRPLLAGALEKCREAGVDVMLLKGAALEAVVYREPGHVLSQDIDLLVRCGADELGPAASESLWGINDSGPFELEFAVHHDLDLNAALAVDYPALWDAAREIELHGHRVRVMCPEDMLLFACFNSCRKRFFHPRNLFAIRTLLDSFPELDWEGICRRARHAGGSAIVFAALETNRQLFGGRLPSGLRAKLGVRAPRAWLIGWLVARMSYASLGTRTGWLRNGSSAAGLAERRKWQKSALLPFACYDWRQALRRVRWLLGAGHHGH